MGLSDRTCVKMETEGLTLPEDFADFSEKEDLDALYRTLLKPAKTTVGAGANAQLREVAQYEIPTRSQIRLHVARKMMVYYAMVGRSVEADDLLWPVMKSFNEQWKALLEKKAADAGAPPKLDKNKLVHRWMEQAEQYLTQKIGVQNVPLTYLVRDVVAVPATAATATRTVGQPFADIYTSIEEEMMHCVPHTHNLYKADNNALFRLIDVMVVVHEVSATIAPFRRMLDGRGAFLAIKSQHAGRHVWDKIAKDALTLLKGRKWNGQSSITLAQHTTGQRTSYMRLVEASVHTPTEIPNPRQRVTDLLDSLDGVVNPKLLVAMAAVEQDDAVKRINFEEAVTYLLPSDPVASKKKTGHGATISGTVGATGSPAKVGKTGVKLCWHEPKAFAKLTKEQKTELQVWNRENPTKRKKADEGTGRRVKARVAAATAQSELITAMAESHSAALEVVEAKLSQMTATATPATHAPTATRTVGFTFGAEIAALEESARVSSVKLAGILKKASPKPKAP